MKLTRANAIMLQDKPFVTDSTYREYPWTLTAGFYSAIYFGNVASKTCYCQVGGGYLQLATATGIFNLSLNLTPDTTAVHGSGRLIKI